MLNRIKVFCVIFLMVITQTSCGSIPQNDMGEISNSENNNSANKKKDEEFTQRLDDRESLNIKYEDALGNKQNIETGEINRSDKGTKLYDDIGCFVEDNHFYYCQGIEIYRDKGEKLGEIRAVVPNAENKYYDYYWGKDGERLYVWIKEWLMEKFSFEMKQFVTVDLKS